MFRIEFLSSYLVTNSLVLIATILFFKWYSTWNHDYWKKRGIPFVKPVPFFGTVLQMHYTPSPYLETKLYSELGPMYGHFERNRPCLTVGDPKILKNMLVKDFPSFSTRRDFSANNEVFDNMLTVIKGDLWRRIRTIVTPTLTTGKLKKMFSTVDECTKTVLQNLQTASQKDKQINAKSIFGAYTMDVIASTAFSTKIDSHNNPDNPFVSAARLLFKKRANWRYLVHHLFPTLMKFLGVSFRSADIHFFKNITLQIIEERKRSKQKRNDFLQLLIDTTKDIKDEEIEKNSQENEDISNYVGGDEDQPAPKPASFKNLTVNEMVAQCVIFFLAGYETTASTLSAAAYCLALNEDVQEELRQEIDRVLEKHKGEMTYEAIQEMKYLDNVVSEVLRLFPPIARVERVAVKDYKSPDLPFTIPKGMVIGIPMYAMHRDPRHFPDPEKFDPNRFSLEEKAKRDPYAYMPFSTGPRNCIAMRFALMEMKICLVRVISAFRFKKCPQTKVPLEFLPSSRLTTPKEIIVGLEPRVKASANQENQY